MLDAKETTKSVSPSCCEVTPSENKVLLAWVGLICAFFLGQAIQLNNGHLHPLALVFVGIATGATFVGVLFSKRVSLFNRTDLLVGVIAGALCIQFVQLFINSPGIYLKPPPESDWRIYYALLAVSAVAVGGCLSEKPPWGNWTFVALTASFTGLGLWLIESSPNPKIDVFVAYQDGAKALLELSSPYSMTIPEIYGHNLFYGSGLVDEGRVQVGFFYLPLSLLLSVPAFLVGDVRLAHLAAAIAAGVIMALIAPGVIGRALAALYWFTPRGFFVIEQSWTEPFMVAAFSLCVLAFLRNPRFLGASFGVLFSLKQSLIWLAPLSWLLLPKDFGQARRTILWALLVFALLTLIWLGLDPKGFLNSAVVLHFKQPFRPDALTLSAFLSQDGVSPYPATLAFLLALLAVGFVLIRSPRTIGGWSIGACFVYLLFFALNKQAFCNYYYLIIGMACVGVASLFARSGNGVLKARDAS